MLGNCIVLFGGTSPCPEQRMSDEFSLMDHSDLYILDFSPNLKTLCKRAVIQYSLEQSGLPHDIRWELTVMSTNSNISPPPRLTLSGRPAPQVKAFHPFGSGVKFLD